ncbi:hypothetical protein [Levilactobacillus suantsaiihabitans]|uniref:hypothetical protein n=1 Tax=Levilactobacillus suantsaiihabitans TaxID=2487722 RepID=UPI0014367EE8|nr:hypothetical protein [Levilactobacillus suantsaiihabitans]
MSRRRAKAAVATLYYAVVLILVATHQDMLAMWGMAVGMVIGAGEQLFQKDD